MHQHHLPRKRRGALLGLSAVVALDGYLLGQRGSPPAGFSSDARGNGDMRAYCLPKEGGAAQLPPPPKLDVIPAAPVTTRVQDLLDAIQ